MFHYILCKFAYHYVHVRSFAHVPSCGSSLVHMCSYMWQFTYHMCCNNHIGCNKYNNGEMMESEPMRNSSQLDVDSYCRYSLT